MIGKAGCPALGSYFVDRRLEDFLRVWSGLFIFRNRNSKMVGAESQVRPLLL